MSVMNTSNPASVCFLLMPNSEAAFMELMVSPPALASRSPWRRTLCLEQVRGKIWRIEGGQDRPKDLAANSIDGRGRVLLQGLAKSIVGRNEEPCCTAMLHHRFASHASRRIGVIGVVNGVGIAVFVGNRVEPAPESMKMRCFSFATLLTASRPLSSRRRR